MQRRHFLTSAGALSFAGLLPERTHSAERLLRVVVPYAPGGPTDAMARVLQDPLQNSLGANLLIDNVPGAGGALGAQQVLRAPADGKTLFLGNNGPSAVTPLMLPTAGFDPLKDFIPVSMIARATMELVVSASLPVQDLASFLAYARAHPGQLNYASAGIGSLGHLATALLARQAGLKMTHVPYKGQAPTLNAILGDEVQVLLTTPTSAMHGHIASGRLKLIAVTSEAPSPLFPKADRVASLVPGFVLYSWFALMARAGTAASELATLRKAVAEALDQATVKKRFEELGVSVDNGGPEVAVAYIRQDVSRWGPIIKALGIKAE